MPDWQPNWQDVRWDWAAADLAASELDRAADEIDRTSAARANASERATADWRGAFRTLFDAQLQDALGSAWQLSGAYREAAARIRQASARAREEQASRERARARWYAEKAQEDRARALAKRLAAS